MYTIKQIEKDKDNNLAETTWMNKKLEFDNETFEEIIPKMESWFSVTIHIAHSTLLSKRFTATIENENLEETLNAMQLSYPFTYVKKGSDIWISKK